jgi:ribokinase
VITVFGSINVDLVSRVKSHPRPGETVTGSDYQLIPGGKGANQALAAARAGADVRLIGAVGSDDLARVALGELEAGGVDLRGVARKEGATGLAIIIVDESGENSIVVAPGANSQVTADLAAEIAFGPADTLLIQLEVPFAEGCKVARRAYDAGARVVLSVAPFRPLSADDVAPASILVMNEHEAADFAGHLGLKTGSDEANVAALGRQLGKSVIATLGAEGAVAARDGRIVRVPALRVTPVDTTGAGDTFAGVLAAFLDEGADLAKAMALAAVAGSLATTKHGAQPSFPTRAEIERAAAVQMKG